MLLTRIALLGLSTALCTARAEERHHPGQNRKRLEFAEFLGQSNILQTTFDGLGLIAPLEPLITPALQVGVLDTLEKFVRVLLQTLTGLDEISNNDTEFFRDLDGTATLIQMLENVNRTAESEQASVNWNSTIGKLLDDMQYEVERLPERTRQDATEIIQELREVSSERKQLKERSGNILEGIASDLATQLLRVSNTFGPRAVHHISRLGGAGIFQMIHDDINAILNDPRMQVAPREILERISEIGNIVANQRDHVTSDGAFPLSLLESWRRILSIPNEVMQALERCRSELLTHVFSTVAERMEHLGIPLPVSLSGITGAAGNLRSSRTASSNSPVSVEHQGVIGANLSLISRSAELLQNSAEVIADTLVTPVNILLSPLVRLGRDAGQQTATTDGVSKDAPDYFIDEVTAHAA